MRKKYLWGLAAGLFLLAAAGMLTAYIALREPLYYTQQRHYIQTEGTVSFVALPEDGTELTVGLSGLDPAFQDRRLRLVGDALTIARRRGLDEALQVGSRARVIAAPKTFQLGAVPPMAALSVDGVSLVDFTEGYPALLAWLDAG